ncbi:MAG: hypothetical protein L6Q99_04545 [Planctomycetes bacterium]|nr:hypothetical protein [Planctomycetota bacterium]
MKRLTTLPLCALLLAFSASGAFAQIIVHDGDDLAAIVAAAPTGSVIEIQGDGPFAGTVSWLGKRLELRAGAGFKPTLLGDVRLEHSTTPTHGVFVGLRMMGDLAVTGTATIPVFADAVLSGCELEGRVSVGGTGKARSRLVALRTRFGDWCSLVGTGDAVAFTAFADSEFASHFNCSSTGAFVGSATFRRCRFADSFSASCSALSRLSLSMESCLLAGPGMASTGVQLDANVRARLVNTTITGFGVGLSGAAIGTYENMLVYGNLDEDLGAGVSSAQVAHSLIEDGTFAGLNGNFGGTPLVGPDYRLLPGSIGVDAGNDAALALGARDFYGDARVQDGDGDGVAHVDVGAVEL